MPFQKQEFSPLSFAETIIKVLSKVYPSKVVNEAFLITSLENLSKMGICEVDPRHKRVTILWKDEEKEEVKPLKKEVSYVDDSYTHIDELPGYTWSEIDNI